MTGYVALFRGINVGGRHSVPMQDLRDILTSLGCEGVQTYIQSGNAVFRSQKDADTLTSEAKAAIRDKFGFAPRVLLLSIEQYEKIVAANPYPDAEQAPKYLHAPNGIGRLKLATKVENCLGVEATARNWRTVSKLREMASDEPA